MADMPETKSVFRLFIGRRRHPEEKKYWLWYDIDPDLNTGKPLRVDSEKERFYTGKMIYPASPGAIIQVQATLDNKSIFPATVKLVGTWKNQDDVTEWNALSRAVDMDIEAESAAISKLKQGLPAELLAPFRTAYRDCNARQRAHILAWVIQTITG